MAPLRSMLVAVVATVATTASLAASPSGAAGPSTAATASSPQQVALRLAAAPGSYTPRAGVKFNNPMRSGANWTINRHINQSIRSAPPGSAIRIFSWNFSSNQYLRNLSEAHRRGVTVRVVMSRNMARQQPADGDFARLKNVLSRNGNRTAARRSYARTCAASCRGVRGIPHTKMYLFSRAGAASNVVMVSSSNMTDAAALNQWGDVYTLVGNAATYNRFVTIFEEAARDRVARRPYQVFAGAGGHTFTILPAPAAGQTRKDPWLRALAPVSCTGATNARNGRTVIRVGQTAILDERGIVLARRIKRLWNQGCNIRILTAELGGQVQDVLRSTSGRGPVPIRQLVRDPDGDGVFDKYIHMKSMSVRGHYGANRRAQIAWAGTVNWTRLAMISDEVFVQINRPGIANSYENHVNNIWGQARARTVSARTAGGVDPFSLVEIH